MTTTSKTHAAFATLLLLAGCATTPTPAPRARADPPLLPNTSAAQSATVVLMSASGTLVSGKLTAHPQGDGVQFSGMIGGLAPRSVHAIHVHEKGDCSAADASSAGPHFNPTGADHGQRSTPMHHAGDMDNFTAGNDGVARIDAHASGVSLGGGARNDISGRAVIVHLAPDDYHSQPAGNAGARVACGIIKIDR